MRRTTRHIQYLFIVFFLCLTQRSALGIDSPPASPGPYYFVSDSCADVNCGAADQYYWRTGSNNSGTGEDYAGVQMVANYNLLAALLGYNASDLLDGSQQLVNPERFPALGQPLIQPFAYVLPGDSRKRNLPIGASLSSFLRNPIGDAGFDLIMPFNDPDIALSDSSATIRPGTTNGVWHVAVDFDYTGHGSDSIGEFDVVASAKGFVERTATGEHKVSGCADTQRYGTVVLRHTAANGRQFFTVYQHLYDTFEPGIAINSFVTQGQKLGKVRLLTTKDCEKYAHLHFALAANGPQGLLDGKMIPTKPYLIDPFGVYDYRRNKTSLANYNYLPNNKLDKKTKGRIHGYAWRTDPPIGSVFLPERLSAISPNNLSVRQLPTGFLLTDDLDFELVFLSLDHATKTASFIKQYSANQIGIIGNQASRFSYILANGTSPIGSLAGEDCVGFNPNNIALNMLSDGRVQMVDGNHAMFVFPDMLVAGNALSIIRKYGFNRSCFVGRPNPSFQYMRKDA